MFWFPQFEKIQDLIEKREITEEEVYGYYEVKTETYEKPKKKDFTKITFQGEKNERVY